MRPSLSFIEESGSPIMVNLGNPAAVSVSTRTRWASTPTTAAVNDVASIRTSPSGLEPVGETGQAGGYRRPLPIKVRRIVEPPARLYASEADFTSAERAGGPTGGRP